jgi:hypothetical protein
MAKEVLILSVPPEMVPWLAMKQSAAEAWDAIKMMCVSSDKVQKGRAQQLGREFEAMTCRNGEKVDDFALHLSNLVINLEELGEEIEEQRVVEKLLRSVPPRFEHLVTSIETLLDISSLSLEEVTGRLKAQEDRMDRTDSNRDSGKLLYADVPGRQDRESGEGLSRSGGKMSQRRRPPAPKKKEVYDGEVRKPSRDDTCHNCGRAGH